MDINDKNVDQIMKDIQSELVLKCEPYVGKTIKASKEEISNRLKDALMHFYPEEERVNVKVIPTEDDAIFDVDITMPIRTINVNIGDISKKIQIISCDGSIIDCDDKCDVADKLIDDYRENSDVCIGEMLSSTEIHGLPVQDVVDVFAYVMFKMENDEVTQTLYDDADKPEIINRWEW